MRKQRAKRARQGSNLQQRKSCKSDNGTFQVAIIFDASSDCVTAAAPCNLRLSVCFVFLKFCVRVSRMLLYHSAWPSNFRIQSSIFKITLWLRSSPNYVLQHQLSLISRNKNAQQISTAISPSPIFRWSQCHDKMPTPCPSKPLPVPV